MAETINYQELFIPEKDASAKDRRTQLVNQLEKGIDLNINGDIVTFVSRDSLVSDKSLIGVDLTVGRKKIAWVEVEEDAVNHEASKIAKYYDKDTDQRFKGKGLISATTSLLFQVLSERGVKRVVGKIETDNDASINSRLKTKDLILDGFYNVQIRKVVSTVPKWRRSGKDNYEVITALSGDSRREFPLTFDEAFIK